MQNNFLNIPGTVARSSWVMRGACCMTFPLGIFSAW